MTVPFYSPLIEPKTDGYTDPNLPIISFVSGNRNSFGGISFKHTITDSAGVVVASSKIGNDGTAEYRTFSTIMPHMALLYNAHGGIVTPHYADAIDSFTQPFNFVGMATTGVTLGASTWDKIIPLQSPTPRYNAAMAFRTSTNTAFLFGGIDNFALGDTWEYDGTTWTQRLSPSNPSARSQHAMTYSINSDSVYLHGGLTSPTTVSDETWQWTDLNGWLLAAILPVRLASMAIAFDHPRDIIVLFGGYDNTSTIRNDTWEFNESVWTQITTANSPLARYGHSMCFDLTRNRTILFGGFNSTTLYNDTWEYDGVDWQQISFSGISPPARYLASMIYDASKKQTFLFGGTNPHTGETFDDAWVYDGIAWTEIITVEPSVRAGCAMTYDPSRSRTILFGGAQQTPLAIRGDTWEYGSSSLSVRVQTAGDGYVFYDASPGRPVPAIGDFVGPGAVDGTITTVTSTPVFGTILEPPIVDPKTSAPLQLTISGSSVGLVRMKIGAFYGFLALVAPSITNFTPSSGIVGDTVTINGSGFVGVTGATFDGDNPAPALFTVVSNIQVLVTVPAGAQTGTITLTNSTGSVTSISDFTVEPVITSITATFHSWSSAVSIHGHTLSHAAGPNPSLPEIIFAGSGILTFNGTNQPQFTVVNDTRIDAFIPTGSTTGLVTVTTVDGSSSLTFTIIAPPTISNLDLLQGHIGSLVGITGTFLNSTGASGDGLGVVEFVDGLGQSLVADRVIFSDTQISAVVPDPMVSQGAHNYTIHITTDGGIAVSSQTFVMVPKPTFLSSNSFSPTSGSSGTLVTITGQYGFTGLSAVFFDGYASQSIHFTSDTSITAVVPVINFLFDPNVPIIVVSAGGSRSTADANAAGTGATSPATFEVILQPEIDSFTPTSGKTGDTIHLTGSNLLTVGKVFFNGMNQLNPGAAFTIVDRQHIDVIVPNSNTEIIDGYITVVNGNLSADTSLDTPSSFTYLPPPSGTADKSNGGFGSPPTQVTITGSHLTNSNFSAPTVLFGGVQAVVNSTSPLVVTVPQGAHSGLSLTTDGGSLNLSFTVIPPPIIYFSTPTSGQTSFGGTKITIVGNNFNNGTTTVLFYNGTFIQATYSSLSVSKIEVNTAQLDPYINSISGTTFTIFVRTTYDSGNGSYRVQSPNTYFGFQTVD